MFKCSNNHCRYCLSIFVYKKSSLRNTYNIMMLLRCKIFTQTLNQELPVTPLTRNVEEGIWAFVEVKTVSYDYSVSQVMGGAAVTSW